MPGNLVNHNSMCVRTRSSQYAINKRNVFCHLRMAYALLLSSRNSYHWGSVLCAQCSHTHNREIANLLPLYRIVVESKNKRRTSANTDATNNNRKDYDCTITIEWKSHTTSQSVMFFSLSFFFSVSSIRENL